MHWIVLVLLHMPRLFAIVIRLLWNERSLCQQQTRPRAREGMRCCFCVWTKAAIKPRLLVFKKGLKWWCASLPPDKMRFTFSSKMRNCPQQLRALSTESCMNVLNYVHYHEEGSWAAADMLPFYFSRVTAWCCGAFLKWVFDVFYVHFQTLPPFVRVW